MTYDDETEVASRSKRRGEIREWGPAVIYKKNSRALICFLALASGLGVVALTCGRLGQAPTDGVVLV